MAETSGRGKQLYQMFISRMLLIFGGPNLTTQQPATILQYCSSHAFAIRDVTDRFFAARHTISSCGNTYKENLKSKNKLTGMHIYAAQNVCQRQRQPFIVVSIISVAIFRRQNYDLLGACITGLSQEFRLRCFFYS